MFDFVAVTNTGRFFISSTKYYQIYLNSEENGVLKKY